MDISKLEYVEAVPNVDSVFLTTEPQKRKYTKHKPYKFSRFPETKNKKGIKVIVDGVEYESVKLAEQKLGFGGDTLGAALRAGKNEALGHSIAYVDEPTKNATQPKADADDIEYLYKVENGYLKIYRKELCQSYKVCVF